MKLNPQQIKRHKMKQEKTYITQKIIIKRMGASKICESK